MDNGSCLYVFLLTFCLHFQHLLKTGRIVKHNFVHPIIRHPFQPLLAWRRPEKRALPPNLSLQEYLFAILLYTG